MFRNASSDPSRLQSEAPRTRSAVVAGAAVATVALAGSTAFVFLTPATYRASASIEIVANTPEDTPAFSPLEAARRLQEAVLDTTVLARLAAEQAVDARPEARNDVAHAVQSALQIDSANGRVFNVSFRDSNRERVESRCNQLAALAAERGPRVLGPERSAAQRLLDAERENKLHALIEFLTNHPEINAEPTDTSAPQETAHSTLRELRAERADLERRLAPVGSDNPYGERSDSERARLEHRLAQVVTAIAEYQPPRLLNAPKQIAPEVRSEWQRLLADAARARQAAEAAAHAPPPLSGRVLSVAVAPNWPIEPNRPLWLGLGALASLLLGAIVGGLRNAALSGRFSSRPPSSSPYTSSGGPATNALGETLAVDVHGKTNSALAAPPLPRIEPPVNTPLMHELKPLMVAATPIESGSAPAPTPAPPAALSQHDAETPRTPPLPTGDGFPETLKQAVAAPSPPPEAPEPQRDSEPPQTKQGLAPTATPVPAPARSNSDRPRAAVEVQAPLHAPGSRLVSSSSLPAMSAARTTQSLGSPIPPILAPGSRRTPAAGQSNGPRSSAIPTSYRYVSTPVPPLDPSAARPPLGRRGARAEGVLLPQPLPKNWRADLSLLPESRRGLCDEVYPFAVDGCCVIAVVAYPEISDGKSRLSAELALALAESGHARVLLLEGNLQRPSVQRFMRLEMPAASGFSQQLDARVEARPHPPWVVMECAPSLHVLAEGLHRNPELVLSQQFEECVRELRAHYDFIVIDGPTLSEVPACRAVHDVIDAVILLHGTSGGAEELNRAQSLFPGRRLSLVPAAG